MTEVAPERARLPVTESQRALLAQDGPSAAGPDCRVIRWDVTPGLPDDRIVAALATLVAVQPALCQAFGTSPQVHSTLLPPPRPEDIAVERMTVPPAGYQDAVAALAQRLAVRPFALTVGPAYRFGQVRAEDGSAAAIVACVHRSACDGELVGPVTADLAGVLGGEHTVGGAQRLRAAREEAYLRELAAQDFASDSEETAEYVRAWSGYLQDVPPLRLDPRPYPRDGAALAAGRLSWRLSRAETAAFRQACGRLGVGASVWLTAVYGAVLARHGGAGVVAVASSFAARRTEGSSGLCGPFASTLPVTVEVSWQRTFDDHVGRTVRDAAEYCQVRSAVTLSQLAGPAGWDNPAVSGTLQWSGLSMRETVTGGLASPVTGSCELAGPPPASGLWLLAGFDGGRLTLDLVRGEGVMSPGAADGLLHSLRTAVRRALADGSYSLAGLFTDAPPLTGRPAAGLTRPGPSGFREWIGETAARSPDAVAVEEPGRNLAYGELAAAAGRVATELAARSVSGGDVVGIALDGLCDSITAMLAVLRRGATYLPLEGSLPQERLAYQIDQAKCRLIIGHGISVPGAVTVGLDDLAAPPAVGGGGRRPTGDDAQGAVYLMFTSGSTGQPKGVLMGEGPLLNLASWQIATFGHDRTTRFLQYAPLSFDVSFQEILPVLAAGGTVVSRDPADRRDFPALARRVLDARITHLFLPVAALRPFAAAAARGGLSFPALRRVCVSGEQLLVDEEIRQLFARHPQCTLTNLYGPTETNAVTAYHLGGSQPGWPAYVPIGSPLPGVAAYVVEETGHLAPVGVPGELYLGGSCTADGYLDPERTAASFLPDRFSGPGRMYRTGDQVVADDGGQLVFLGRRDNQVKVRGYRIELGEIEAVAKTAEGVAQAAAVAWGAGADRELVLFLLAERGKQADQGEVKARLASALPPYMVPAWIFETDHIPTSRTGKTDRESLVEMADQLVPARRTDVTVESADYADETERQLAEIWAAILGTSAIARDRSLLEYGAHSLNILSAFTQIQDRYGMVIPAPVFFGSPTIATLAGLVRESGTGARSGR